MMCLRMYVRACEYVHMCVSFEFSISRVAHGMVKKNETVSIVCLL